MAHRIAQLQEEHDCLDDQTTKMEKVRDTFRDPDHKAYLSMLKKRKLFLRDQITTLEKVGHGESPEEDVVLLEEIVELDDVPGWGSSTVRDALANAKRKVRITVEDISDE